MAAVLTNIQGFGRLISLVSCFQVEGSRASCQPASCWLAHGPDSSSLSQRSALRPGLWKLRLTCEENRSSMNESGAGLLVTHTLNGFWCVGLEMEEPPTPQSSAAAP